jgi:hypothetical protein
MEGKKPRPCYIWRGKVYDQPLTYRDAEPAVAVTAEDYMEVREALVWIIDNHAEDTEVPLCRECGAAGGRWPCATNLEANAALSLLPEVPHD